MFMKVILIFLMVFLSISMFSCRARKGCPTNGKNVGAERLLSGDAKTMKAVKRAGKFKS
jgi:hypothetical protein